jgi:putative ABC transport system substrate-binding protein
LYGQIEPVEGSHMKRREFITGLVGTAVWPVAARAQQRRIAVLVPGRENDPEYQARTAAFVSGLRQHGWVPGPSLAADYRWGGGDPILIDKYAKELLQLAPAVVFTNGTAATTALQRNNSTNVPIVFAVVSDPNWRWLRSELFASQREHHWI